MKNRILRSLAAAALSLSAAQAQGNPFATADDIRAAEGLYQFHCSFCHGRGDDGMAANLKNPRLPHAPSDGALFQIIRAGIPGTDMPLSIGLTDKETWQLVAYVRALGRSAPAPVRGSSSLGQALFWGKGICGTCHMVAGKGGRQGPDLSDIGARRAPSHLRQSLVDPEASIAAGFLLVEIVTRDGKKITGTRVNENTFSIQVRDFSDKIHSLRKSDLAQLNKQSAKSTMPSYRQQLSDQELDDLVAHLYSLRGGL